MRLAALRFAVDADRLTLTADRAGNLRATDAAGQVRLAGNTPQMWDADNVRVKAMATTVARAALLIKPDRAMLVDPRTEFPVYIDPGVTAARTNYVKVDSGFPTTSYLNPTGNVPVGTANGGTNKYRSFFNMDVRATPIVGKHIVSADFIITETHSWSCSARKVDLWGTGYVSAATTWNNQPAWSSLLSSKTVAGGYSASCPAQSLTFDATAAVRSAADENWQALTVALRSPIETDNSYYKTFNNNPILSINYLPYKPVAGCPGGTAVDSDFNGDGQSDVAIGAPGATVDGFADAGTVTVRYTGSDRSQVLRQGFSGVPDTPEAGDRFGHAVTTYDANQDGCADLVVGAPFETVGSAAEAGGVAVLFGGPGGFTTAGTWYDQASTDVADDPEAADWFGFAVTAGNTPSGEPFLAIGAPGEDAGAVADAGLVHYRLGSANATVAGTGTDDRTGYSLAGTPHHLAIGSPGRTGDGRPWAGAVSAYLHQISGTTVKAVDTPLGTVEADASFGKSIDMVPVSGTTNSLLAVGAPGMSWSFIADAGQVITYQVTPTEIKRVTSVHHPAAEAGDYLGEQVRLSRGPDQTLVAGAHGDDVDVGRDGGLVLAWSAAGVGRPYQIRIGRAEQENEGAYMGASAAHLYLAQPVKGEVVAYSWTAIAAAATTTSGLPPTAAVWSGPGGFGTAVR